MVEDSEFDCVLRNSKRIRGEGEKETESRCRMVKQRDGWVMRQGSQSSIEERERYGWVELIEIRGDWRNAV